MRILFIGTSHGVPEHDRRCSCTMLEVSGRYYFIDMGTQAIEDLRERGISVEDVKGIFVTHCHGDHTNGLISFVDLICWYFKSADPVIQFPEQAAIDAMRSWIGANGTEVRPLKLEVVKEGLTYEDGFIKIHAIRTQHCRTSYAYLIEAEGKRLLFTGDLKNPRVDFPDVSPICGDSAIDLAVCESAHFPPNDTEAALAKINVKRVLHNHISPVWDRDLSDMAAREHPYTYGKAHDGLEIEL